MSYLSPIDIFCLRLAEVVKHPSSWVPYLCITRRRLLIYFFASSLIGQNKQLEGVRAIGTDGERPLIDAFMLEFGFAQHLTCFIHVRRNIKDKLDECAIPSELTTTILRDFQPKAWVCFSGRFSGFK